MAGKRLEVEAIVSAVVEIADMTGAPAPGLRAIHAATDLLARTHAARGAWPDRAPASRGQHRRSS